MANALDVNRTDILVIKEGYIHKESSFWKKDKQRWMVLTKGKLSWFKEKIDYADYLKSNKNKKEEHCISLDSTQSVRVATGGKDYQFEVDLGEMTQKFTAESYYEMEDWIAKIQHVQNWVQTDTEVYDPDIYNKL